MKVVLNGEPLDVPGGATVAQAVELSGAPPSGDGIAVAVEGEVVPRGSWATQLLEEGQNVEVLQAVQGG
jgi:sulfur carrier protein